jgi:hypothetical protein
MEEVIDVIEDEKVEVLVEVVVGVEAGIEVEVEVEVEVAIVKGIPFGIGVHADILRDNIIAEGLFGEVGIRKVPQRPNMREKTVN